MHREAAVAVEREQVEHAAVAAGERRHLRVEQIAAQPGQQLGDRRAQPRLKPALRLHAEERIGVRAVGMAAEEEAREELAAEVFVFLGERSLVGARAKGDFVFAGKGVGRGAVAHPRKLQAMQQQPDFSGRAGRTSTRSRAAAGTSASRRSMPAWQRSMAAAGEKA